MHSLLHLLTYDGNRDQPSPKYRYRAADLLLLEGLSLSDTRVCGKNPRRLFPLLECLEIGWLAGFCSDQYFPEEFRGYYGERIVGEGVTDGENVDDDEYPLY
ncbi:hypothetical protein F5Y04DRAFT_275767 [Hypomontagnella monticulosa]|nr:hypothetical protein F5Y04DRAFT_275767 [Hypomontagnella monticulosa]